MHSWMKHGLNFTICVTAMLAMGTHALGQNSKKATPVAPKLNDKDMSQLIANQIIDNLRETIDEHFHQGEYNHIINISKVIQLARPEDLDTVANAGWLLWSLDRDQDAINFYKQSIADYPKSYFMYDEIGYYYYLRKKDYKTALGYYIEAAKFKDVTPTSLHMYAHCYEKLGEWNNAIKIWEIAIQNKSDQIAVVNYKRAKAHIIGMDKKK